jgi:hypothetical protein
VVDYIVFMTYDLHGQWDANNKFAQEGCGNGMCLRSHVNLTETKTALAMVTKAGVASNKVVVGVSSYGRSFAMADGSCYGPMCAYTGTALQSNAEKGPCTDTAGYIADAEIADIIAGKSVNRLTGRASRVSQNFVDTTSNSRIVVFDDNQWVAYMDDAIRSQRTSLYQGLQMGGTTNWAIDLETYNDAPIGGSWDNFKLSLKAGTDPYSEGPRSGNWTKIGCDDQSVEDIKDLTSAQRWTMMDGPDAWSDIVTTWKQDDRPTSASSVEATNAGEFTQSVSNRIHGPQQANCGVLGATSNCDQTLQCAGFIGDGSGAAGYETWNSFVMIHETYQGFHDAIVSVAALSIDPALADFENTFAPVPPPPDTKWLDILLACVGLVGTIGVSSFFNSVLKTLPFFVGGSLYDNSKDAAKALVSFSTSITSALTGGSGDKAGWTAEKQATFSAYLGQAMTAWDLANELALATLFDGSDNSLSVLTDAMGSGQMIAGSVNNRPGNYPNPETVANSTGLQAGLANDIGKAFWAYAMTNVWPLTKVYAFVVDSGYDCSAQDPMTKYISTDNQHKSYGCYNNKLYYLVYPKEDTSSTCSCGTDGGIGCHAGCTDNLFSLPPGLDTLDGSRWNGVKVSDIIAGAVRTYQQNGNQNGGQSADITNSGTLSDLMNKDFTTPGFIRLPVCSADMAFTAWGSVTDRTTPNWPCVIKPSPDDCGDSTFVDQTSDASPSVSDCMGIVNNIQGTQGEWEVENAVENQHQIVQNGNCKFGVQGTKINGNIDFHVGAQDIVDIITQAVKQFGGSGKVGAKGEMSCKGTVKGQDVEWGLY